MDNEPVRRLPPCLMALLWDVDPNTIEPTTHEAFVLGRILSAGTLDAIRWARGQYGDDAIRAWIIRHEGRQLSGPQLRVWEAVVGLPGERVDAWIATPERRLWEGRAAS
jgi:hypothetical protein